MAIFEKRIKIRGQEYMVRAWRFERGNPHGAIGNVSDPSYEARAWEESSKLACRYPCMDSLSEPSNSIFAIDLYDVSGQRVVRVGEEIWGCSNQLTGNENEKSALAILKRAVEIAIGMSPLICFLPDRYLDRWGGFFGACSPGRRIE